MPLQVGLACEVDGASLRLEGRSCESSHPTGAAEPVRTQGPLSGSTVQAMQALSLTWKISLLTKLPSRPATFVVHEESSIVNLKCVPVKLGLGSFRGVGERCRMVSEQVVHGVIASPLLVGAVLHLFLGFVAYRTLRGGN